MRPRSRSAAGAGKPHLWVRVVAADDGGVDVGVPVELGCAEEAEIDAPRLQPVVEHLGHARRHPRWCRGRHRRSTAAAIGFADRPGFVDEHQVRRLQPSREVCRRGRQPNADEADSAISQRARGGAVIISSAVHVMPGSRGLEHVRVQPFGELVAVAADRVPVLVVDVVALVVVLRVRRMRSRAVLQRPRSPPTTAGSRRPVAGRGCRRLLRR